MGDLPRKQLKRGYYHGSDTATERLTDVVVGESAASAANSRRSRHVVEGGADVPGNRSAVRWGDAGRIEGTMSEGEKRTILIVEDHVHLRQYVRGLLEGDYRVIEAANGQEGLWQARRNRPDLVVADVMMPKMDGFSMVESIRKSPRVSHIPVLMLTVCTRKKDRVRGLNGGADVYMTKPFDRDVLTAQISRLIVTHHQFCRHVHELRSDRSRGEAAAPDKNSGSFERRVRTIVGNHLSNADLTVEDVAEKVGCARRTLTRRVKASFGLSPSALIRTFRLEKGADLLEQRQDTVSEIAYAVGFNSLSYFSRRFKKHFGVSPSRFRKKKNET